MLVLSKSTDSAYVKLLQSTYKETQIQSHDKQLHRNDIENSEIYVKKSIYKVSLSHYCIAQIMISPSLEVLNLPRIL